MKIEEYQSPDLMRVVRKCHNVIGVMYYVGAAVSTLTLFFTQQTIQPIIYNVLAWPEF